MKSFENVRNLLFHAPINQGKGVPLIISWLTSSIQNIVN